jgi:hypothetical protein
MNYLKLLTKISSVSVLSFFLVAGNTQAEEQSIHDRMFHHRAIDAVVWAMPLLNFKYFCDVSHVLTHTRLA